MRALKHTGPAIRRQLRRSTFDFVRPTSVEVFKELPRHLKADVYVPPGTPEGSKNALIVHGGGFVGGSRGMSSVACLATDLVHQGFVVASVDYRLARPWGVSLDTQEEDVEDAVAWWAESAGRFRADADRTALIGLSAGGALAMLATPVARFQRFVGIYGAYDLELLPARWASTSMLVRSTDKSVHAARSPIQKARFPQPVLLVHGLVDDLTPPAHAERLLAVREQAGLPTEVLFVEDAQHGFLQEGPTHPHAVLALRRIREFLADL